MFQTRFRTCKPTSVAFTYGFRPSRHFRRTPSCVCPRAPARACAPCGSRAAGGGGMRSHCASAGAALRRLRKRGRARVVRALRQSSPPFSRDAASCDARAPALVVLQAAGAARPALARARPTPMRRRVGADLDGLCTASRRGRNADPQRSRCSRRRYCTRAAALTCLYAASYRRAHARTWPLR